MNVQKISLDEFENILANETHAKRIQFYARMAMNKVSKTHFNGIVNKHARLIGIINPIGDGKFRDLLYKYYEKIGKTLDNLEDHTWKHPDWKEYHRLPSRAVCIHSTKLDRYLEVYLPPDHALETKYECNGHEIPLSEIVPLLPRYNRDETIPVVVQYKLENVVFCELNGITYSISGEE